jgi:hypothetical protein
MLCEQAAFSADTNTQLHGAPGQGASPSGGATSRLAPDAAALAASDARVARDRCWGCARGGGCPGASPWRAPRWRSVTAASHGPSRDREERGHVGRNYVIACASARSRAPSLGLPVTFARASSADRTLASACRRCACAYDLTALLANVRLSQLHMAMRKPLMQDMSGELGRRLVTTCTICQGKNREWEALQ